MDVVNEIEILETDVRECDEKCQRVNCNAIYDANMSSLKLMYHLISMCCKIYSYPLIYLCMLACHLLFLCSSHSLNPICCISTEKVLLSF
jgi:hypothetical protein